MRHGLNRNNCTCAANVPILYDATWLKQNQLYLCGECADPDANEDMVPLQAGEDVALAVDLACVDLIEESHHDKRVEDQCEVLCRDLLQFILMAAIVNIKRHLACNNIHNTTSRLQQHVTTFNCSTSVLRPSTRDSETLATCIVYGFKYLKPQMAVRVTQLLY